MRSRLIIDESAARLNRFFRASVELMKILARACGHRHLNEFTPEDLTSWKTEMARLTDIKYGGLVPIEHD